MEPALYDSMEPDVQCHVKVDLLYLVGSHYQTPALFLSKVRLIQFQDKFDTSFPASQESHSFLLLNTKGHVELHPVEDS